MIPAVVKIDLVETGTINPRGMKCQVRHQMA